MAIDDLTTEQAKAKEQELIANKLIETIKGNNELQQDSQNKKASQQDNSKNPIVALRDSLRKTTVQYNDSVEKQNLTHRQQNENIALNDAHMTESSINEGQYQSNKQYANQLFNALGVPSDPLQLSKNLQQAMNLESDIDYQLNVAIPTKTKQAYENEALSNQHSLQQIRLNYDQSRRNIINAYNQVIEDRERFKEVLGAKNIESRLSSYLKSQAAHDFQTLIAASANTRQEAEQEISYGFWGNTVEAAGRGVIHLLDKSLEGWGLVGSLILGDGKGVRPHIVSNLAAKLGFNNISLNDITRNNFGFTDRLGLGLVSDTLFNSLPEMFAMGGALGALTKFGGRLLGGMEGRLNSAIARAGSNTELRQALTAIKDRMANAKWSKNEWNSAVEFALKKVANTASGRAITAKTIDDVLKGAMKADAIKSGLAATYMISDYAGRVNDMINQRGPNATLQISDLLTAFIHMGVDYAGAAAVFAKFFKAPEAGIAKYLFGEHSSVLKAVPGQMAIEGVGEGIQTYMEALSRHSGALPDLLSLLSSDDPQYSQLKSELAESSVLGALSGGIIGGAVSGAASITNKVSSSVSSFRNNERMRQEGEQVADTEFDGSKHAEEYAAKALDPEKQNKNILAEANNNLQSIAGDIQNIAKSEEDLKDMKVTRNNEKNKEIVGRELQKVKEEQQNIAALEKMQQEGKELTEEQQQQLSKKDALETRKNNLETLAKKLEEFDDAYRKVNEAKIAHEIVSATMDSGLFKREDAAKIDEVIEKIANAKTKEESNAAKNELIDLMNLEGGNKLKRAKAALLKALNQDPRIYSRTRDIKDGATTAIKGAARAVANAAGKTSTAIKGGYSRAARAARAAGTALFGDEDATIETGISEQQEESTTQEQSEETQDASTAEENAATENTEELDTETTVENNQEEETESEQDKNYENLSAEELKSVLKELDADVVFHLLSNELTTNKNKNGSTKGMSEATKWMQTQFSVLRMGLSEADMSISGKAKKRDKSGKDNSANKIPQLLKRAITDLVIIKNDRYFFDFQSGNFIRFFHTVNDNQQAINRVTRMATTAREMFNSQMPKKVNDIRDEIAKLAKIKKDVNPELYQQQKEKIVSMINDLKETYGKNLDTLNLDISYMRMFISSVYGNSSIATQLSTLTNNISAQLLALTKDAKDIKQLFDVLTSKNIPESKRQQYLRALEINRKRKAKGKKGWNIDELIARYSEEEESSETTSETKDITSTIRESISTIKKSISPVLDGIKSIVNDVLTAEQEMNQEQLASAAQTEKEKQLKNAQEVLLEMQSFFEDLTDIFTVSHIGSAQLYLARNQYINALATTPKTDINLYDNFNIGVMNEALLHMFLSINETMLYDMFKVDKAESALNAINNIINAVLLNKYETNNPAFQSLLLLLRDIKVPIKNILVRRNITDNTRQDQTQEGMISLYDLLSCNEVAQDVYFTQKDIEDAVKAHNIEVEKYNTKKNQKENPIPDKVKIVLNDNGQVAPHEKAMIAPYLKEILRERLLDKQRNKQFRNDLSLAILRNPAVREEINTKLNMGLIILARDLISRSSDTNNLGTIDKANSTEAVTSYKKEEKGNNFYYAEKYKAQQELPFLKTMLGIEDVKDINIDDVYQQIMYLAQSHLNSLSYDVNGNPLLQFKQLYILDKTGTSATGRSTTYMIINKDFVRDLKDLYGDTLTEQFKESSSQDSLSHLESIESYNKRKGKDFKPTTAIDILEANTNRLAARDIAAYVSDIFGISIDDMVNKIATSEAIEAEEYNDILEAFTKNTNSRRNTINTLNKGINRNNPLMYIPVRRMVYNDTSKTWSKKTDYYYLPDIIGENATKQFIAKINDNISYTDTMNSIANDFNQTAKATVARMQSRYNNFSDFIYIRGNQIFNNDKELSGFSKFDGEMNFNQDFHIRYKEIETSGRLFTPTTLANPINNKLIKDVMTTDGRHHDVRDKLLKEDRNIFEEDSVEAKKIKRGLELAFYQIFGKDVDKFALTDDGKAAIKALNKNKNYVKNGEIIDPEAYDRAVLEILEKHTDYTIDGYSLTNLWKMISNISIDKDIQPIYDEFMYALSQYQEKDLKAFDDHPFLSKRNADVIKDFLTALLEGKKDYYKKMYHHSMSIYVDGSATGVFENMIKYKSIPVMAALAKVYTGKSVVFSDNIEEWTEQDLTDKTTQHFQGLSQAMKIEVEERLEKILKDNGILKKYENVRDAINKKGIDPYTLNLAIFQVTMAKYAVAWPDNLYAQIVGTTQVYNRDLIKKLILPLLYGAGESSFFVKAFVLALPNHNKQLFSLLEEFQRTYNPNQERGKNDTKSISDDTLTDIRLKFLEFLNSKSDTNNIAKIYYQYLSNGNQVTRFHSGLFKNALKIKQTSDRAYYMLSIDFNAINSNIGDFSEMLIDANSIQQKYIPDGIFQQSAIELQTFVENYDLNVATSLDSQKIALFAELEQLFSTIKEDLDSSYHSQAELRLFVTETMANIDWLRNALMDPGSKDFTPDLNRGEVYLTNSPDNKIAKALGIKFDGTNFDKRKQKIVIQIRDILRSTGMYVPGMTPSVHDLYTPDILISRQQAAYTRDMNTELEQQMMYSQVEIINKAIKDIFAEMFGNDVVMTDQAITSNLSNNRDFRNRVYNEVHRELKKYYEDMMEVTISDAKKNVESCLMTKLKNDNLRKKWISAFESQAKAWRVANNHKLNLNLEKITLKLIENATMWTYNGKPTISPNTVSLFNIENDLRTLPNVLGLFNHNLESAVMKEIIVSNGVSVQIYDGIQSWAGNAVDIINNWNTLFPMLMDQVIDVNSLMLKAWTKNREYLIRLGNENYSTISDGLFLAAAIRGLTQISRSKSVAVNNITSVSSIIDSQSQEGQINNEYGWVANDLKIALIELNKLYKNADAKTKNGLDYLIRNYTDILNTRDIDVRSLLNEFNPENPDQSIKAILDKYGNTFMQKVQDRFANSILFSSQEDTVAYDYTFSHLAMLNQFRAQLGIKKTNNHSDDIIGLHRLADNNEIQISATATLNDNLELINNVSDESLSGIDQDIIQSIKNNREPKFVDTAAKAIVEYAIRKYFSENNIDTNTAYKIKSRSISEIEIEYNVNGSPMTATVKITPAVRNKIPDILKATLRFYQTKPGKKDLKTLFSEKQKIYPNKNIFFILSQREDASLLSAHKIDNHSLISTTFINNFIYQDILGNRPNQENTNTDVTKTESEIIAENTAWQEDIVAEETAQEEQIEEREYSEQDEYDGTVRRETMRKVTPEQANAIAEKMLEGLNPTTDVIIHNSHLDENGNIIDDDPVNVAVFNLAKERGFKIHSSITDARKIGILFGKQTKKSRNVVVLYNDPNSYDLFESVEVTNGRDGRFVSKRNRELGEFTGDNAVRYNADAITIDASNEEQIAMHNAIVGARTETVAVKGAVSMSDKISVNSNRETPHHIISYDNLSDRVSTNSNVTVFTDSSRVNEFRDAKDVVLIDNNTPQQRSSQKVEQTDDANIDIAKYNLKAKDKWEWHGDIMSPTSTRKPYQVQEASGEAISYTIAKDKSEMPSKLYYAGDISLLDSNHKRLAIIGSRDITNDIADRITKYVKNKVPNDVVVISGLASGADITAMEAAVDSGKKVVAILPCPINATDSFMSKKAIRVLDKIIANGGLVITEYNTGGTWTGYQKKNPQTARTVQRNRLQALYATTGVLLTASDSGIGKDSGSRHAMDKALQNDIPTFVFSPENNELYNMNRQYGNNGKTKTIDNNHIKPTQPTITPQTSIPSNTKTIDVWWGSNNTQPLSHPSKFLSNMANRPFMYRGREYQSVEHAYQTWKSGNLNENAYKNFKPGKKFHELGTKKENNWNLRLMQKLITTSLLTNSRAREYIRHNNYFEGYTFTHKNGDTTWSKYFGPILMNSINMIKFADTRLSETKDGKDLLQAINLMPLAKRPKVKFIDSNRQVDKDIAMANDADIGIMLWSNNSPGTLNNMKNMSDRHKPYTVYNANGSLNENESNITPLDKDIATDNVTFFISGSRYINALPDSNTEFGQRMDSLNGVPNVSFVVGDAVGVDTNMIKYFVKNNDDLSNVTIYSSRKSSNPQSTPPNTTTKKGNARGNNQYTPEQLEIEGRLLEEGEFKRVLEDRKQQELSNLTDQTEIDAITASYDTAIAVFNNLGNLQVGESTKMSDGRMGEQQTTYSRDENGFVKATNVIQLYGDQRTHTALHETWHGLMDTALHSEFGQRFNEAQNLRHRLVSIMNETINELNNDPEKRLELGLLDDVWEYIINQPTQDLVLHEFYAHFLSQPALAAYLASKTYNQTLSRWNKFIATRKGQNIFKQGANLLKTILGTIFDLLTLATIRNSGNRQALALKTIAKLSAFNTLEGIEQYQRNYNNKLVVRGNKLVKKGFHFVSRNIFKSIEDYIAIKGYSEEDIRGLVSEIRTTLQRVAEDLMPYMEQIHDKDVSLPKKYFLLGLATMKMVVASRHIMANPIEREIAMNVLSDIRQQLFEGTFFDFKFNIDFGLIVNKTTKKIVKEVNTIVGINTAFQQEEEIAGRSASNYMKSIIYSADNPTINAWIEENEAEDPDFRKKYSLAIGNYLYVIKPQDYFFNEVSPSIDEVRKIVSYMINDNVAQTQKIRREIGDLHKDIMKIIKENNSHLSAEELEVYSNHIRQSIVDLALTRLNNVSTEDFGTQNVEQILYQIDRMIHNQHKVETSYNPDTGRSTYRSRGLKYSNKNANNGRDITSDTNYQRIVKNLHKMLTLQTINLIHGEYDITKDNNKGKIGSVARFNEETKMITQKALTAYEEGQREFKEEIIDLLVKGALFVHQQEKRYYTKQVLNYSVARGYYENGENISDRFFLDNAKKGTTLSKKSPSYEENKQSLLERGYVISSETESHTRFISKDALWIEKPIFGRDIPLPYYHEGFIPYQQYNPEVDIVTMHIPEDNLEQQEKMEEMLQNYLDKGYEISETYSDMERGIYVLVNNSLITQYHNPTHRLGYIGSINKAKGKVIDVKEPEMYASEDYTNRTIDSYYERMYEKVKKRGFTGKPTYKDRANKSPKRVMESSKRLRYETGRDMIENLAKIDRSVEAIAYNQEKLITRNQHKDFVNTQTWFHILSHQDEIKQRGPGKQNEHHHAVPLFELHPHERMAVTYSPGTNEWIYEDFRIVVNEDVAKQYNLSFSHEDLSTLANALKATGYNYDTANKDGGFGDTIYVDTNALPMLFGYQDFDPHKIADNDRIKDGRLQKGISTVANILRGLVKESRNNTIIRNPALALENFKSNTIGLIAEGVPVTDTFDSIPRVIDQLFEYQQLLLARKALYTKASTIQAEVYEQGRSHVMVEYRELKKAIRRMDETISNHQLNYVMQNGFYTNIVEDAETIGFRWDEALIDKISKKVGGLNDTIKAAIHEALVTEKGEVYNSLAMFTRLGDFVPRVIYYNHLVGMEGVSKEEAIDLARDKFINYNVPMWSPSMRLIDKFGVTNYLKYKTAIQRQILLAFKNNPIQASSLVALQIFAVSNGISQAFAPSTYLVESLLIDGTMPSSFFGNPATTLNRYNNFLPL